MGLPMRLLSIAMDIERLEEAHSIDADNGHHLPQVTSAIIEITTGEVIDIMRSMSNACGLKVVQVRERMSLMMVWKLGIKFIRTPTFLNVDGQAQVL